MILQRSNAFAKILTYVWRWFPAVRWCVANGVDVTDQIRTPEMSLLTSRISALKPVREAMLKAQQQMGSRGGVVLEGRDIGTVVFPDAEVKFYLSASAEERAQKTL